MVGAPYSIPDVFRARDQWLPAITAWVDGDASMTITQGMLDSLDVMAQLLIANGSEELAATVTEQYRLLQPATLLGQPLSALQTRYESLPTIEVLRSGFEAGEGAARP